VEGEAISVALLNRGIPSYRMESSADGEGTNLLCSLLRSPAVPTYLHEPEFYTMTDWDGMRDAGEHDFALALTAYDQTFAESDVTPQARSFNAGLLAVPGAVTLSRMPEIVSPSVRIAAVKWAEQGNAVILRLHEYRGRRGPAILTIPFPTTEVTRVNLLERAGVADDGIADDSDATPLTVEADRVKLSLGPWEIATLRLDLPGLEDMATTFEKERL
jgi:alpha-mannosidase